MRRTWLRLEMAAELVPSEPMTVVLSEKGWIRAAKGRVEDPSELKFKEGDKLGFLMYPQAESAQGRYDALDPDNFKYTITAREIA